MNSKYFDHTILKPDATLFEVDNICKEAIKYDFASVCVNSCYTKYIKEKLRNTNVKVCTVIGFPLGACTTATKAFEANEAIENGADEIDMVINIGALKDKKFDYVENEIKEIKKVCKDKILKVIIETCLLTQEEKIKACNLAVNGNADFVKTSTGFSLGGATTEDVKLMKETVNKKAFVKASGGIRNKETAMKMIEAGADRLGTSATVNIISNGD